MLAHTQNVQGVSHVQALTTNGFQSLLEKVANDCSKRSRSRKHVISKNKGAVIMTITVEDIKRCNIR